jgi:D-cysteine desulfhydrase
VADFSPFPAPTLPTPVVECSALHTPHGRLWLKHDGLTHPVYGGNKIRKLLFVLDEAERVGARRILTFGATGSHHVLATALLARARGIETAAILTPQPMTPHVEEMSRAIAAQGVRVYRARSALTVPIAFLGAQRTGDYVLAPGASTPLGARGYVEAVLELARQVRAGLLREPDVIVVPLGSGGTAAGLLAGVVHYELESRVLAVTVSKVPFARAHVLRLARKTLAAMGSRVEPSELEGRLIVDREQLGAGYGHAPDDYEQLAELARRELGLGLDQTYTAKAFAAALSLVRSSVPREHPLDVLYWHTLSATPLEPLLEPPA